MDNLNLNLPPVVNTGIHTVIVAVIAILFGSFLEKFFASKPTMWVLGQLALNGVGYDLIREHYQPDPDAWVVFAATLFYAQPSLLPKLKALLNIA